MREWTINDAGCLIAGHLGWHAHSYMVQLAVASGFPMSEDDAKVLREYKSGLAHLQDGVVEAMTDLMDAAENWLNQNRAPHGYTFGWFEGEFFLAHERWWNDQL